MGPRSRSAQSPSSGVQNRSAADLMKPRELVFGLVFCFAGCLLFLISGFEHPRRVNYAREHPAAWVTTWELTTFGEGSGCAGLISVAGGVLLGSAQGVKTIRRRIS